MTYRLNNLYIPDDMIDAIKLYIYHGINPGDFLTAVISNDLRVALRKGSNENIANLPAFLAYFYNEAPENCWGSQEKMRRWIEKQRKLPTVEEMI